MSKFKKHLLVFIALALIPLCLYSCKKKNDDTPQSGNLSHIDDNVIFSPDVEPVLVLGEGISETDVGSIKAAYYAKCRKQLKTVSSNSEQKAHEIIIGKTDRALSAKAYRSLEIREREEDQVGFAIHSDGKSIAIAFDDAYLGVDSAFTAAIEYFVSNCFNSATLKVQEGRLYYNFFNALETQIAKEKETEEWLWAMKEMQMTSNYNLTNDSTSKEIINELKSLRLLYENEAIVAWLANLYDPETGGFYFSNSARNNIGYLPDLESTSHALGIVELILNGYGGSLSLYFGEEISAKFVSFVKAMQDAEDGYFYHPQWTKESVTKTVRRSRDLLNATTILESFSASPTYDTPNGVEGDGVLSSNGVAMTSCLTRPLNLSKVISVSTLLDDEENDIYIQPHLKSKTLFEEYLGTLDIVTNTYDSAQALVNQVSQIKVRDAELEEIGENYRLSEIVLRWLSSAQNSQTGVWEKGKSVTCGEIYETVKVVELYTALGGVVPRAAQLNDSIIKVLCSPDSSIENITDLANIWMTVSMMWNNLSLCGKEDDYSVQNTRISLFSVYSEMVKSTREHLIKFKKSFGSFSSNTSGNLSTTNGLPIALPNQDEGNISATLVAVKNLWISMFNAVGIGSVPLFNTSDRMLFQKTLLDMGVIVKNEIPKSVPIDFEDEDIGNTTTNATLVEFGQNSSATIIEGTDNHGNVLNLKAKNSSAILEFAVKEKIVNAPCNILELDMCILPDTSTGYFGELYLYPDMYMISLNREGNTVKLYEESSRSSSTSFRHDLGVTAQIGEWFKLRVEYYVGTRETVRIKVFFNDECIAVTNNFFGTNKLNDYSINPAQKFNCIRLRKMGESIDVCVDNVVSEHSFKSYVPENSVSGRNIDAPDTSQKIHNFETTSNGKIPDGFILNGNSGQSGVQTDAEGNKYLAIAYGGVSLELPLHERGGNANSALVDFYLTVDEASEVGAKYEISFNEYQYKHRSLAGIQIVISEDNGNKYVTFAESLSKKTGNVYSNLKFPLSETLHVRAHFFFEEDCVVLMINNNVVGISTNVLSSHKRAYMGEVTISNLTSSIKSTLMIDNLACERVNSDYLSIISPSGNREIYTFDSYDGIETSGSKISNGVLSFEEALSNSYAKIPVNARSAVAMLGIVNFDVKHVGSSSGEFVISFTDASDNVTASFSLLLTSEGIDIFEFTESGRYSTPLYRTGKTEFKLSFEYSPQKESFNILINDSYVASTSVTYNTDGTVYDFEVLKFSTIGIANVRVDNVIAETLIGSFTTPTYSGTNSDDSSETVIYEQGSFAFLPSKISSSFASRDAALRIRVGNIKGRVSKVLEFTSGMLGDSITFKNLTKTASRYNAVAFETYMMVRIVNGVRFYSQMTFRTANSTTASVLDLDMVPGSYLTARLGGSELKTTNIRSGDWFKFRIEYAATEYDFDYDGEKDVVVRLYIDDVLIDEAHDYYSAEMIDESEITRFQIRISDERSGKIYLDNTRYEQFVMDYDAPVPADTHTLTYEPGVITKTTVATLGKGSSLSIVDETVEDKVTKVLKFNSESGTSDKLDISVTQLLEGANAIALETDICINSTSDSYQFFLEPINAANKQPFRLVLTATKNGNVVISGAGVPDTVIGKSGEWIHLKVEYTNPELDYTGDGKRDILCKIYVDTSNIPLAIGYTPYSANSYYTPTNLIKYRFTTTREQNGEIRLDNTKFWQINITPDENGEPLREDDIIGQPSYDPFDKNGWS